MHLFGSPAHIGAMLRQRVRDQIGLLISVGAARTKHLAKIASQVAKPDGIVIAQPGREWEFLDPLPVGAQSAVGRRTPERADVRAVLAPLADRAARRMRAKHRDGRTVTVRVRFAGMRVMTRSQAPSDPWRPGSASGAARRAVDGSMDAIWARFGGEAVGYPPAVRRTGASVPDEFRELAEHDL